MLTLLYVGASTPVVITLEGTNATLTGPDKVIKSEETIVCTISNILDGYEISSIIVKRGGNYVLTEGEDYVVTFTPADGYTIDKADIIVKSGGVNVDSSRWTFDEATNTLTIPKEQISNYITISVSPRHNHHR